MTPPASGVKVRMYRPGAIGDCFLLAFPGAEGSGCHVLVDCGSLADTGPRRRRIEAIAGDVEKACGGRLDLVIVTHPHWDHLSGFHFGREVFDRLRVDRVWLPWTANPADPKAELLANSQHALLRVLHVAAAELRRVDDEIGDAVAGVLEQWGELGKRSGKPDTERLLGYLRRLGKQVHYLTGPERIAGPEAPQLPAGLDGVRFHVLGPTADLGLLTRANPLDAEVIGSGSLLSRENANLAAALDLDFRGKKRQRQMQAASAPFDADYRVAIRQAEKHADFGDFYAERYGSKAAPGAAPAWRRLESDFLIASSELVTRLDADVDNASLSLAIELQDGRVLLFPGDAQMGAWGTWKTARPEGGTQKPVADLLAGTVLYKLSHHGGQNGTPLRGGVELMTHPDLMTMAPVDERQAQERKWGFPFGPTLEALNRKMKKPALRADRVPSDGKAGGRSGKKRPTTPTARRLWLEVEIP